MLIGGDRMKEIKEDKERLATTVSKELLKKFKIRAIEEDLMLNQLLEKAMKEYLERNK